MELGDRESNEDDFYEEKNYTDIQKHKKCLQNSK